MQDLYNGYVKLRADGCEAVVSVAAVMSYGSSYLAHLVQIEVEQGSSDPAVRLQCDAEEAKEVVAVLRQGSRYKPPQDNPRLVESLRHTLDFLGLPAPHFPSSSHSELLLLPAYAPDPRSLNCCGLLMYSASSLGWADTSQSKDPMPKHVFPCVEAVADRRWLAAVVPSEYTNAGEDLVFMLPNDVIDHRTWRQDPVLLRSSLATSTFLAPSKHWYCDSSALAAASGKLYLFGGRLGEYSAAYTDGESVDPSRLEVFEPHRGAWFSASSPLPEHSTLVGHALVPNQARGLLLVLGGSGIPGGAWDRNSMAKYDTRAGSWTKNPSNCMLPDAADMAADSSLAAVAADDHTIMLLRAAAAQPEQGAPPPDIRQPPGRVDLLDLRMWRWRVGAALQRDCVHSVGLVEYDGKLLALGGCQEAWEPDAVDRTEALHATDAVSSYDLRGDSWSQLPARLPLPLSQACPVVVRMPGVQL